MYGQWIEHQDYLEQIAWLGWEDYEWSITVVWKDTNTGKLYLGDDSGCSCYGPWEDVHSLSDLVQITNIEEIRPYVNQYNRDYYPTVTEAEKLTFINDVRNNL
jgi:hypothetical protein